MRSSKKNRIRTAAFLAALVLTAGVPLTVQQGTRIVKPITAYAEEEYTAGETDAFYYEKYADHIVISGAKSMDAASVEIPDTIDSLPVTEIGIYAFQYCEMSSLKLPDTITEIGAYTFSNCNNLTELTLPASLKKIKFHSFENCEKLETIHFPDQPVIAGDYTFDNTPWLEAQRKKDPLVIVNNAVIDGRTCEGDVVIPSGVKCIATGAFSKNEKITSVTVPSSVTEMFENTFWYCTNLTSVTLGSAVELGNGVFGGCDKLTELKLGGRLKTIEQYTFDNNATATVSFGGSEADWNKVTKPAEDAFLQRAKMVFNAELPEETPAEVKGDLNADGKCDIADAVLLQRYLSGDKVTVADWEAGDLNGDGKLTAVDLSMVKRVILS